MAAIGFPEFRGGFGYGGAKTGDVVKSNIYFKGYKPEDAIPVGEALRRYFPEKNLPASTWLGVQALSKEGFLVEVDAVAVALQK